MSELWRPTASIDVIKKRSKVINDVRGFFHSKGLIEVETPILSQSTVTDLHLQSFETKFIGPDAAKGKTLFLQTSPEYAMKRLLSAEVGSIFQISKAFRNEESGRFHNPEFTMLEWYQVGYDHFDLMNEVSEFAQAILGCEAADQVTYQAVFESVLDIDPLTASLSALKHICGLNGFSDIAAIEDDKDTLLQLLFSQVVERQIGLARPCIVYDFPASQAALAKISESDQRVAERFEMYFKGVELANGFHELTNADEQILRFEEDNKKRVAAGLEEKPIDQNLIAALAHGMPNCSGVALGIDRLLMIKFNASSIEEVMPFTVKNA